MKLLFELLCPWSSSALWYFTIFLIYGIIIVLSYKSYTAKPFLVWRLLFEIQKWILKCQKAKRIVPWCLYTYMCIKLLFFSWNPAVQILPPTVYILFTIYRNVNQMYFSPLLRLLCGTINDYLDGLDWVPPVKCCCCCFVTKLCLTLCELMDYSSPGSSVHGILQTRILEWVAIPVSRGFSPPREWTWVSCIGRRVLYHWATREVLC